jgi:hypothetical protein
LNVGRVFSPGLFFFCEADVLLACGSGPGTKLTLAFSKS